LYPLTDLLDVVSSLSIVADPDPRHFVKPDPDPHQSEKPDPDEK
jgi:hypothetical protein